MGDTPGVFMDAQFVGLLLQIPVTITFLPDGSDPVKFLLITTEVEVFNGKKHLSTGTGRPERHCQLQLASSTTQT